MKKLLSMFLASVFSVSLLVSCGGGGGGSAPTTDPETIFPLKAPGSDVPGYNATGSLSGTVTAEGINYNASGTISLQTRNIVFLNSLGVNAMPVDTLVNIDVPQLSLNLSILSTVYLNADTVNNEPVFSEDNQGLTGTPLEVNLPPDVGQVGDFGKLTSWAYNNGWTETGTWSLDSSTPGYANLVQNVSIYDSQNNLISTGKITSKINEMGEPVFITYFQNLITDGVVLNFSGNIN